MRTKSVQLIAIIAAAIVIAVILFVVMSVDNTADPTNEDVLQAEQEWLELGDTEQNIICNVWIDHQETGASEEETIERMTQGVDNTDPAYAKAKIAVMERECD